MIKNKFVIVRGGGDLATGTIHRLWSAGFSVLVLETEKPAAIRRQVSVCEAVYDGEAVVEDMTAIRINDLDELQEVLLERKVAVFVDPYGTAIEKLQPEIVVDAILAKKNLGTRKEMAPLTIGLGPGFVAGVDVHYVIETQRGHNLGRIIKEGIAAPNTGVPGNVGGYTKERVLHSPVKGIFYAADTKNHTKQKIGNIVQAGDEIAVIKTEDGEEVAVKTLISGIVRGLLRDGYQVTKGFKIGDIDPRMEELANCFTISDKARCISGSVLELCIAHKIM